MELNILEWIQSLRTPLLDTFFTIYTTLGDRGEIWFLIMILTGINKNTRYISVLAFLALIMEVISVDIVLKPIFMRQRPFEIFPMDLLIGNPHGSSFPSGHSGSSFAVAGVYLFTNYKHKWFIVFLAVLMAFSRLYHFVHFPSDVLAGSLIGLSISYLLVKFFNNNFQKAW